MREIINSTSRLKGKKAGKNYSGETKATLTPVLHRKYRYTHTEKIFCILITSLLPAEIGQNDWGFIKVSVDLHHLKIYFDSF